MGRKINHRKFTNWNYRYNIWFNNVNYRASHLVLQSLSQLWSVRFQHDSIRGLAQVFNGGK